MRYGFAIFLLFLGLFLTHANSLILDDANILSPDFKAKLTKVLQKTPKDSKIFVITLNSLKNSPSLHELGSYIKNEKNRVVALIVNPKSRKAWIIRNQEAKETISDEVLGKIDTYYLLPYFANNELESGIYSAVVEASDALSQKTTLRDILGVVFLILIQLLIPFAIIGFILYMIVKKRTKEGKKVTSRKFILVVSICTGILIGGFLAATLVVLINFLAHELLLRFPSIMFVYLIKYSYIIGIALFVLLFIFFLRRSSSLKELKYEPNRYLRGQDKQHSSSYSSYSSSSSYSGGGGSFGGGGASGGW